MGESEGEERGRTGRTICSLRLSAHWTIPSSPLYSPLYSDAAAATATTSTPAVTPWAAVGVAPGPFMLTSPTDPRWAAVMPALDESDDRLVVGRLKDTPASRDSIRLPSHSVRRRGRATSAAAAAASDGVRAMDARRLTVCMATCRTRHEVREATKRYEPVVEIRTSSCTCSHRTRG